MASGMFFRRTLAALVAAGVIVLFSVRGTQAFCVGNETNTAYDILGGICSECLTETVAPQGRVCCEEDKPECADQVVSFKPTVETDLRSWTDCPARVGRHGWVLLRGADRNADAAGNTCVVLDHVGKEVASGAVNPSLQCPGAEKLRPSC